MREKRQAYVPGKIRSDLPTHSLPETTLIPVYNRKDLQRQLFRIFQRNPSPLNIAPRNWKELRNESTKNSQYYLLKNRVGKIVGGIGFQPRRNMIVHLTIDYIHRGSGYGLSGLKELEKTKGAEGITEVWCQVFKDNKRAISMFLSLGWVYVKEKEGPNYVTLVKSLIENKI